MEPPIETLSGQEISSGKDLSVEHPIAKDLMTPWVYMIPSMAPLEAAVQMMWDKRQNAVIVLHAPDEEPDRLKYYSVTQTNINDYLFRHLSNNPNSRKTLRGLMSEPLSSVMEGPIEVIEEGTTVDRVIRRMINGRAGGYERVLIGRHGQPSGVLSKEDILMWNNKYFKPAKPLVILAMENDSSVVIDRYVFQNNLAKANCNIELLDHLGPALKSVSLMTEEMLEHSGEIHSFQKDNYSVLFEPRDRITGILVCDHDSLDLRRRLYDAMNRYIEQNSTQFSAEEIVPEKPRYDLSQLAGIFGVH